MVVWGQSPSGVHGLSASGQGIKGAKPLEAEALLIFGR